MLLACRYRERQHQTAEREFFDVRLCDQTPSIQLVAGVVLLGERGREIERELVQNSCALPLVTRQRWLKGACFTLSKAG